MAALLVLAALLFSMQSLVVTPTTDGAVDGATRAELRGQAGDVLTVAADSGSLSRTVRYWNASTVERTFAGAVRPSVGYGEAAPPTPLGAMVEERFLRRGYRVNLVVAYLVATDPPQWETARVVYRGVPSEDAVVATHTVTLFDDDGLTGPDSANATMVEASRSGMIPIPDVAADSPVYNVAEARLVVW